jgi:hypothetical protein
LGVLEFLKDLLKTGIPGLVASALAFFRPIVGIGLAHESWEIAVQKAASFFGALITLYIVFKYGKAPKDQKLRLIRINLYVVGGMLIADMASRELALEFARHDPWIHLFRDIVWPVWYFLLCVSALSFVGFLGQLLRRNRI